MERAWSADEPLGVLLLIRVGRALTLSALWQKHRFESAAGDGFFG